MFRTYSGFCARVKIFHGPNPYYVTASIHSPNTHALREAERVKKSLGDFKSNTMERLKYGKVKLGADVYEDYSGSQKPMVN
jgi:hypothetical protein